MAPVTLRERSAEIQSIRLDTQSIPYDHKRWAAWIGDYPELSRIADRFPNAIRRDDLRSLARDAVANSELLTELFIATMLFGFGGVGYGPFRTSVMLAGLREQPALLDGTVDKVLAGDLIAAHSGFDLARCRGPFFTKFFYAVGLGADLNPIPLILDDRVYRALDVLHQRGEIDQYHYYGRSAWTASGYANYVHDLNEWARELGTRPDSLEMYLFQRGAEL